MDSKKLILGSANVNTFYGIKKNKIKINEFIKLTNYAYFKGVKIIDTSPMYKDSEKIIGSIKKKFSIITKIPKIPSDLKINEIEKWIKKKIETSQKKIKNKEIYGILIQNAEILFKKKYKVIIDKLLKLKRIGYFKKVGISVYDYKILQRTNIINKIDFVQVPYNVFNQNLFKKKILNNLKKKKVEIHARSIFLQGLLLKKKLNLPKKLEKLEKEIIRWRDFLKKKNITPLQACLSQVLQNKKIDKLVIGFDSIKNFREVFNLKKKKINLNQYNIKISQFYLDPRNWS